MLIDEFDYDLPPDRIAQEPARDRDGSSMLILDPASRKMWVNFGLVKWLP